jgi:RNA polymerase sigma-70 factor (ECF subfamily)
MKPGPMAAVDDRRAEPPDFNALIEQHRPRVFRFFLASVRNRETAENLTQDCLIRA